MKSIAERQRLDAFKHRKVEELLHLTHISNLKGILQNGLLPRSVVEKRMLSFRDISYQTVQNLRRDKEVRLPGRPRMTFRDLVPLFLVPKTPMLSRLRETTDDLCFVVVKPRRICEDSFELLICDGNAAADGTTCHSLSANTSALEHLPWAVLTASYWRGHEDGKRKRAAEILVWPKVPVEDILCVVVFSAITHQRVSSLLQESGARCECRVRPNYFFEPPNTQP